MKKIEKKKRNMVVVTCIIVISDTMGKSVREHSKP